jgi:LysR family transcriptional regulator, glycine cleavage system transcriptional activator
VVRGRHGISASTTLIDVRGDWPLSGTGIITNPTEDADIAIRFGSGWYPGFQAEKLLPVTVTAMCSPRLLDGEHPLRSPIDLQHHALLKDDAVYFAGEGDWELG